MTTYDQAEESWTNLIRIIHRFGHYRVSEAMAVLDDRQKAILKEMGGFYRLCISAHGDYDREVYVRKYIRKYTNNKDLGGNRMKITLEFCSTQEMHDFYAQLAPAPAKAQLMLGSVIPNEPGAAPVAEPKAPKKAPKKEAALPVQTEAAPAPAPIEATAPAPAPAPAQTYTHEQVARAAAKLIRANPATKEPIKALLANYKADMIPRLPAEALPAFAQEIKALGGEL